MSDSGADSTPKVPKGEIFHFLPPRGKNHRRLLRKEDPGKPHRPPPDDSYFLFSRLSININCLTRSFLYLVIPPCILFPDCPPPRPHSNCDHHLPLHPPHYLRTMCPGAESEPNGHANGVNGVQNGNGEEPKTESMVWDWLADCKLYS